MWSCFKECVSASLPGIGTLALIGIVVGLTALFLGSLVTGGAAAGAAVGLFAAVEGVFAGAGLVVVGGVAITSILAGLIGCLVGCLVTP